MGGSERAGTRGGETRATRIKSRFDDVFTFVLYNSRRRCDAAERGGWRGSVRDGTGRVGRETFEGMCSGATLRDPRWRRVFGVRRHGSSSFARGCLLPTSRRGALLYRETGRPTTSRAGMPTSIVPTVLPTKGTCFFTLEG